MATIYVITHPEVVIDPAIPVPEWSLSTVGRDRIKRLVQAPWFREVEAIYCSAERKARDCAEIAEAHLGRPFRLLQELGENDRGSTGYLPREEFEATADQFFAHPGVSIRGWETALHAQARVTAAMGIVLEETERCRNVAVFGHGGVSALYLCRLKGVPIARAEDQPSGRGNYYAFDAVSGVLLHGWRPIGD